MISKQRCNGGMLRILLDNNSPRQTNQLPIHSTHQISKPENDAMFACQMLMVLATKKAKPTYQLPKIDAKNVESLSAAIMFCKSDNHANSCCKAPPILQNRNFLLFSKLCYFMLISFILLQLKSKTENIVIKSLLQKN